jgi:predicted DsbA family dithiol-disulfide isomerase
MDRREYLETKFGGRENAARVYARIDEAAQAAGLEIDWEGIERHAQHARRAPADPLGGLEGRQTPVVAALFRAYWREGRDIGDAGHASGRRRGAGLDRAMTLGFSRAARTPTRSGRATPMRGSAG